MARTKKHPAHENHERWLVSYADFITLLFAFFVVMFASSQADKAKAKQVSESVRQALEDGRFTGKVAGFLGVAPPSRRKENTKRSDPGDSPQPPKTAVDPKQAELAPSMEYLKRELAREIESGKLRVTLEARGLVVSLREAAFFPTGEDTIYPATYPSIEKIAVSLEKLPNPVRLEGHTDSVPIHNARFHSNWELSAARSIAVLELLTTRFGIPPQRLAVAGYADTVPVDSNGTEEGRSHNRRVDIVILNRDAIRTEPGNHSQNSSPGPAVK